MRWWWEWEKSGSRNRTCSFFAHSQDMTWLYQVPVSATHQVKVLVSGLSTLLHLLSARHLSVSQVKKRSKERTVSLFPLPFLLSYPLLSSPFLSFPLLSSPFLRLTQSYFFLPEGYDNYQHTKWVPLVMVLFRNESRILCGLEWKRRVKRMITRRICQFDPK